MTVHDTLYNIYINVTKIEELLIKHDRIVFIVKTYIGSNLLSHYFQIPLIVLSAISSVVSVGLQAYISHKNVSAINRLLSLLCGMIQVLNCI
jgi:hypothetical protein